ncbi:hypothetical protein [Rhizobium sp. BR 362]|uniref:hypothetical protein n=1 Tax=Rhizobium sp. BR 362 TaxID=3040670 RepID=UPI002F40E029
MERYARGGLDKAAIAGLVKMVTRLVRKHPMIAADLLLAGAGRAGHVGWQQIADGLKRPKKTKILHAVPLIGSAGTAEVGEVRPQEAAPDAFNCGDYGPPRPLPQD